MLILERPWTRQPQSQVGVDWSNPITRGLVFAGIGTDDSNLVYKTRQTSGLNQIVGSQGRALAGSQKHANDTRINVTSEVTLFALTQNVGGLGDNYPNLISKITYASESSNSGYQLQLRAATGELRKLMFGVFNNNSYTTYALLSATTFVTANQVFSACGVSSAGGRSLYINGILESTKAATTMGTPTDGVQIGGTGSGETRNYVSFIWNRALTAAEVATVNANPWQLFAPRRIYIPTAAAAATAPTITALSAINITATSAQPQITYA